MRDSRFQVNGNKLKSRNLNRPKVNNYSTDPSDRINTIMSLDDKNNDSNDYKDR